MCNLHKLGPHRKNPLYGDQTALNGSLGPRIGLYQFMSHTAGTALSFESLNIFFELQLHIECMSSYVAAC